MERVKITANELKQGEYFLNDIDYTTKIIKMENSKRLSAHFKYVALEQGMSESEIQEIIITFFELAIYLKLRNDDIKGLFLSLNQMVIKNKVSADDFRMQLGSRIPGVMNIMAETIGVPINELSEMIRRGDIISCDVLPKFAEKLNEAYKLQ